MKKESQKKKEWLERYMTHCVNPDDSIKILYLEVVLREHRKKIASMKKRLDGLRVRKTALADKIAA
jgi:hypothetical protein